MIKIIKTFLELLYNILIIGIECILGIILIAVFIFITPFIIIYDILTDN